MSRAAVLLSGGGARGALQMAAIEHLARQGNVARWCGSSIGAVNGLAAACQRVSDLRRTWQRIDSASDFMRANPDFWQGLYSLRPLRRMINKGEFFGPRQDLWVGVFDYATARHKMVHVNPLSAEDQIDAVLCSAAIPGIHEGEEFQGAALGDGGVAKVLPGLPDWRDFDEIHAVFCQPRQKLKKLRQKDVSSASERVSRAMDYIAHRTVVADHARLRLYKRKKPELRIFVYEPESWHIVGPTFDAARDTITRRLEHGQWMVEHRTELPVQSPRAPREPVAHRSERRVSHQPRTLS